ncbi:hypothetical protein HY570_02940, partial [Candidatus Micrarchaeota archaeon]|nr:hypothetical protein [Candidatus Micrarchaeota archaeon]
MNDQRTRGPTPQASRTLIPDPTKFTHADLLIERLAQKIDSPLVTTNLVEATLSQAIRGLVASDGEMSSQALLSIAASRVNGLDRIASLGWAGVDATVLMELALDIFEQFCVGGKLGVKYEKDKPRTHGCKTALEVFRDREGDC